LAIPRLARQIAALGAERSKVLSKTSFNLQRELAGGIPTGTFFVLGGMALLVMSTLKYGLVCGSGVVALLMWVIGFLLYTLSCWSRWKAVEKKRVSSLAGLDRQIEKKREELQRHRAIVSG
jgi:hypothetical protein